MFYRREIQGDSKISIFSLLLIEQFTSGYPKLKHSTMQNIKRINNYKIIQ